MILGFKTHFDDGVPTNFVEKILSGEKIHTLRQSNRWKTGMYLHMATGVRTKKYKQFNKDRPDLQMLEARQNVVMKKMFCPLDLSITHQIIVDGRRLNLFERSRFRDNDGLTFEQFDKWFFPGNQMLWWGQLIHWTDFKY